MQNAIEKSKALSCRYLRCYVYTSGKMIRQVKMHLRISGFSDVIML